ncbi:hypothetical protein [Streptomyces sp. NBC_00557]|uniref:hypothetical protein n=1 Tax=Streptomyces sp. NBC_00557 TaxID=2975776 RepID=UPI002E81D188|nr:hypothetical protein [Streptomyces sp. NBC_00557]WUC36388.1 hypothetical protein OG956_20265 [Streptomyces sp. NBC_00557]
MLRDLLYALAGRCPVHDRASAYTIAQLETELGIDPQAMATHQANARDIVDAYADPRLIDCGRRTCRNR